MKKIVSTLLLTVFMFSLNSVIAQPGNANPGMKEIRTYFKENVKPELIKQQAKFLSVLSDKEIAELEKIKENWKKVRAEMHGKTKPENRENTQKAHFSAFNSQVEQIVNTHPKEKDSYIKTMTAKSAQWQKDIAAIREKYDMPEPKKGNKLMERINDPAFILMWSPDHNFGGKHPKKGMGNNAKPMKSNKMAMMEPGIKIFPQPASSTVTVRVTGTKGKNINASIYDSNSKKMRELFNAKSTLPVLNFSFDLSDWNNGVYIVKVKFDDRTMTYDFEVKK